LRAPLRAHSFCWLSALRQRLESSGSLARLRAALIADVSDALDSEEPPPAAAVPDENLVINELLREYLAFNHYSSTLSTLVAESGARGASPLERTELAQLVGVVEDRHTRQLPLLYTLVEQRRAAQGQQ